MWRIVSCGAGMLSDHRRKIGITIRLVSVAFERGGPALQYQIVNTLGFTGLPPVQENVVVLAPTAGGKTEAAFFPLLSRMDAEDWRTVSVVYVAPTRALINNHEACIECYAARACRAAIGGPGLPTPPRSRASPRTIAMSWSTTCCGERQPPRVSRCSFAHKLSPEAVFAGPESPPRRVVCADGCESRAIESTSTSTAAVRAWVAKRCRHISPARRVLGTDEPADGRRPREASGRF